MEPINKRYVGRARPARLSALGRVVGRVPPQGKAEGAAGDVPGPEVVEPGQPAAVADIDSATAILESPEDTAAIFVDRSGRRGRRLRLITYASAVLALLLTVAFWVVQGMGVLGYSGW